MKIEVGDVVRLKKGSEAMTVDLVLLSVRTAHCVWFSRGKLHRGEFPIADLKRSERKEVERP